MKHLIGWKDYLNQNLNRIFNYQFTIFNKFSMIQFSMNKLKKTVSWKLMPCKFNVN